MTLNNYSSRNLNPYSSNNNINPTKSSNYFLNHASMKITPVHTPFKSNCSLERK